MIKRFAVLVAVFILGIAGASAQQAVSFKHFSSFKTLVGGIDFYASNRQLVTPYEKPASETIAGLQKLLGKDLPKGAVFICSTLEQKDSVYEPKVLKSGYGWTLSVITPDVRVQEIMERMKSQFGDEIPAEMKDRINNMLPEMKARAEQQTVDTTSQQIAHAVIWAMFSPDTRYRSSRLDDMSKSPLPDWLDIGIAAYASSQNLDLKFLEEHMDQTFSLEDILLMSRPFVASSFNQGSGGSFRGMGGMPGAGGGGMPGGGGGGMPRFGSGGFSGGPPQGFGSRGSGGFGRGGPSGRNGGTPRTLPKDEQDRLLFDVQSATFFSYMLKKAGIEKVKQLIQQARDGKESLEFVTQPDVLGADLEQIEKDWISWIQELDSRES